MLHRGDVIKKSGALCYVINKGFAIMIRHFYSTNVSRMSMRTNQRRDDLQQSDELNYFTVTADIPSMLPNYKRGKYEEHKLT